MGAQPFRRFARITGEDDMEADKTDELIAKAIAALPCRRPSAGFGARVMARIAPAPEPRQARLLRTAAIMVAAWSAAVAFLSAGAVYRGLSYAAASALEPGGPAAWLKVLPARLALAAGKAVSALSYLVDLAASAAGFPAFYEVAAAALACSLIIYSVGLKPAAQRV